MKRFRLHLVLLSIVMLCKSAWAEEYLSEQDYLQKFPVVLSASRLSQPITETPNALSDHYFDCSTQTRNKRRAYLTAVLER